MAFQQLNLLSKYGENEFLLLAIHKSTKIFTIQAKETQPVNNNVLFPQSYKSNLKYQ